jgi:Ubiquitin elongating factor core
MWTGAALADGPHSSLLGSLFEAQKYLAPALLLLYGDVERTGFYEKLTNRRSIMVVLKHLWTLDTHRPAFRGIATVGSSSSALALAPAPRALTDSGAAAAVAPPSTLMDIVVEPSASNQSIDAMTEEERQQQDEEEAVALSLSLSIQAPASASIEYDSTPDENYFIRFANGLMNETNSLVSMTMERLGEKQADLQRCSSPSQFLIPHPPAINSQKFILSLLRRPATANLLSCYITLASYHSISSDRRLTPSILSHLQHK